LVKARQNLLSFFSVASEILARTYENMSSCLPDLSFDELRTRLVELEEQTRILQLFRRVNSKVVNIDFKMNNILVFPLVGGINENQSELEVLPFRNINSAIEFYDHLEKDLEGKADVVLVRADNFENLRITFRNYFADTTDFVRLLDEAVS
jgi:putative GTP pyrophosphokinase